MSIAIEKQNEQIANRMLRPGEVAKLMGVSESTLAHWRVDRKGPGFIRLGDGMRAPVRYPQSEVVAYINNLNHVETDNS